METTEETIEINGSKVWLQWSSGAEVSERGNGSWGIWTEDSSDFYALGIVTPYEDEDDAEDAWERGVTKNQVVEATRPQAIAAASAHLGLDLRSRQIDNSSDGYGGEYFALIEA